MITKALACAMRGRSNGEWHVSSHFQKLELGNDIANSVTSFQKDCLIIEIYEEVKIENSKRG